MAFHVLQLPKTSAFNDLFVKGMLAKWDLTKHAAHAAFSFAKFYHKMQGQEFALDFFNDPTVRENFKARRGGRGGDWERRRQCAVHCWRSAAVLTRPCRRAAAASTGA